MHKRNGFTIVELLIVIVVIAILAGISVVAYNGIQERARNSSLLSSVDAIEKAAKIHEALNGAIPLTYNTDTGQYLTTNNDFYSCVGKTSDYPATSDFAAGVCYKEGGNAYSVVNPGVSSQFDSVVSNLSVDSSNVTKGAGGFAVRGIMYYSMGNKSKASGVIMYYQKGNQECGRGIKGFYSSQEVPGFDVPDGITVCQTLIE